MGRLCLHICAVSSRTQQTAGYSLRVLSRSVRSCNRNCRGLVSIGLENFDATPPEAEALPSAPLTPFGLVRTAQTSLEIVPSRPIAILLLVHGKASVPLAAVGERTVPGTVADVRWHRIVSLCCADGSVPKQVAFHKGFSTNAEW